MKTSALNAEWCLLQNQYDSYEKHSLYIKLVSTLILAMAIFAEQNNILIGVVLMTLWLQDGIWKTFQSRIETRLLYLESEMLKSESDIAFQFNTAYQRSAFTGTTLIMEYIRQAIRPTVAFPYIVLIGMNFFTHILLK
ncbi:hypothetical protein HII17_08925 [Thalassotalea sp. M1531]|uniref:Uncharacterized protein n=1 Tax=Thalassotalea algicola TaxID=2716224 RepID=A0A7Y0Q6R6_9GAMM|nr:hypothetical protein [Thalassotalea algicola]NMP31683.1 hypothetical protein [Thalassotalea algicola]